MALEDESLKPDVIQVLEEKLELGAPAMQSLDGLGASPSNTVILFPVELSQAIASLRNSSAAGQPTDT